MFQLVPLCALLAAAVLNSVNALSYQTQGQEHDLRQDLAPGQGHGQGQGDDVSGGGRQGSFGQQGSFGRGAGGSRSGAAEGRSYGGSQYGGQPGGEDASRYNFRIYTEPEYYGYESKFPGGKAMFKSYRSASRSSESGLGEFTSTNFCLPIFINQGSDISVGIETGNGLGLIPDRGKIFLFTKSYRVHPASHPVGTAGSFSGLKLARA